MGMRTLLPVCIGLCFVSSLAAKPDEVPEDQCLGGWLFSIQPDSITLKFNQKITTFRLAPDAEIWRRGTDVASVQQLVPGDEIYLKCTRDADSAVIASVVAAVEDGHGVDLDPHHLKEITFCGGRLVAVTKDTLSVKNDNGVCVIHLTADAKIWRGEIFHDTSALKLGDEVGARVTIGYPHREMTADEVEANVAKAEGKIVSLRSNRMVVKQCSERHTSCPGGHMTVLYDSRTDLDQDEGNLKKGATVLAIGLDLGHNSFRATSIVVEK
jgi:hypothetical protein